MDTETETDVESHIIAISILIDIVSFTTTLVPTPYTPPPHCVSNVTAMMTLMG